MPPTRSSQHPVYVSTDLANIPFRFRRKSLSEDDLPNPDYYLVPPSPSLSPSRSYSLSSSPPSSPSALNSSPIRPHLDTANIHPPSSPTRPPAYHGPGYAYTYPRGLSHRAAYDYEFPSAEPKPLPPNAPSPAYAAILPPSASSPRSSFSSTSLSDANVPGASFPLASEKRVVLAIGALSLRCSRKLQQTARSRGSCARVLMGR
ncbi:hypothetical protein BD309DRAFT_958190, partial [Dichomitus squalens]